MIRSAKALLLTVFLGAACFAQAPAQTPAKSSESDAYYHFAMGRLYESMAVAEGNRDYVNKAIDHFQQALKLDPSAGIIFEELTDLYVQTGRLQDAQDLAEEVLKTSPNNLDARRMLARIYTRRASNPQRASTAAVNLKKAIEQYQKITQQDPKDAESWVVLGKLYRASNSSVEAEKAFNAALEADPTNEDALGQLASLYLSMGDTQRAIAKLKSITDKSPSKDTLELLAQTYREMHDYKNAVEAMKRAVEQAPDDPKLQKDLADYLVDAEQFDDALKIYQQLAEDDPRDPDTLLSMAKIYRMMHAYDKAQDALDKAKKLDPESLPIRFEEINMMEAKGQTDQAIAALKALLTETTRKNYSGADAQNRALLLEHLGSLYRSTEQYPQAIDAFRQIGTLDPDGNPRVAVQIIDTYRASKDYTNEVKEADAALKKFPDNRMVQLEHAQALADAGKVDEAAAELRTRIKAKPDFETVLALAQIYENGKRWNEVGKALDEAEPLATSDADKAQVHFQRGAMYERAKKFDQAETEFKKVLELNPQHAAAMNYLGYMLADRDVRLDEAQSLIKKALDIDPDNGAYLDSMAWVYYHQGKFSEAETLLLRALEHMQDPTVHDHLGDVYLKLGKTKEAINQWQQSLKDFQSSGSSDTDPDEMAKVNKKLENALARLARETNQKK